MAIRNQKPTLKSRIASLSAVAKPLHICLLAAIALLDLLGRLAEYLA